MSLTIANRQLRSASQQLTRCWDRTRESWSDPVAQRIEARFIRSLHHNVATATTAIEQMHEVLEDLVEQLATHEDAPYGTRLSPEDEPGRE